MEIQGRYTKNENFIMVYTEDTLYTIARNTGEWGSRKIGELTATGHLLDRETFEKLKAECSKEGTFEI